jgi:hypothetical protein
MLRTRHILDQETNSFKKDFPHCFQEPPGLILDDHRQMKIPSVENLKNIRIGRYVFGASAESASLRG